MLNYRFLHITLWAFTKSYKGRKIFRICEYSDHLNFLFTESKIVPKLIQVSNHSIIWFFAEMIVENFRWKRKYFSINTVTFSLVKGNRISLLKEILQGQYNYHKIVIYLKFKIFQWDNCHHKIFHRCNNQRKANGFRSQEIQGGSTIENCIKPNAHVLLNISYIYVLPSWNIFDVNLICLLSSYLTASHHESCTFYT